jgi:uncharacterized damage-inducible protein DinB
MDREKWFDKKFRFELSNENYGSVLMKLRENPDRISKLVSSLSPEVLTKKIDSKWSIQENVGHLIDLEELHDGRIDDFIQRKERLRPADLNNRKTDEANHNSKNISDLLKQLKEVRESFVKRLKHLDEKTLLHSAIHPRLNQPMRPIDMAQFVLEHDEHHIGTIEALINEISP